MAGLPAVCAVLMAAAVLPIVSVAASGAPAAPTTVACAGVAVVVDFGVLGGGTQTGCAAGDPTSGLSALSAAGFSSGFAPSGLICQINGQPGTCPRVPPAGAYWSYWHARPGGSWSYSQAGPGSQDPVPGSVEGWAFGAGAPPGAAPPPVVPSGAASGGAAPLPAADGGLPGPLGFIAGLALVGGLAGLALRAARRRSRAARAKPGVDPASGAPPRPPAA